MNNREKKYIHTTKSNAHDRSWKETYKTFHDACEGLNTTVTWDINHDLENLEVHMISQDDEVVVSYTRHRK